MANFSESINDTVKDKITNIVDNSIIYRGPDMKSASDYIQTKIISLTDCRWGNLISSSNVTLNSTSFAYYKCDCYDRWAHLRTYGDFKWNYFLWAG